MGNMNRQEALRVLAISEPFTEEALKDAYRAACKAAHPDAGGSATDFHDVKVAYDILKADAGGAQAIPRFRRECPTCAGEGYIVLQSGRPGRSGLRKRCPSCNGDGLR